MEKDKLTHAERLLQVLERDIDSYDSTIRSAEYARNNLRKERNQLLRDLGGEAVSISVGNEPASYDTTENKPANELFPGRLQLRDIGKQYD